MAATIHLLPKATRTRKAPPPPQPTREQLELAWRHMRRYCGRLTLDQALQIHHYRICLTHLARRLGRPAAAETPEHRARMSGPPVPPTPTAPPTVARRRLGMPTSSLAEGPRTSLGTWHREPRQWLDVKKLAANDTDTEA